MIVKMGLQKKIEELDDLYSKVKTIYKEAGWRRRNFPLLAKHDEDFNEKTSKLEDEVNSKICGLEEELGVYRRKDEPVPYLTIALRTEDYKTRFNFGFNMKNTARKFCYGISGAYGAGLMIARDMAYKTAPSIESTALGIICGFAVSFFMECYTSTTNQWEEKSNIKGRIKVIKKESKRISKS